MAGATCSPAAALNDFGWRLLGHIRASTNASLLELARKASSLPAGYDASTILNERELLVTTVSAMASPFRTASCRGWIGSMAVRQAERPVDFDAIDNQPVDLILFLLLGRVAPANAAHDHLQALAKGLADAAATGYSAKRCAARQLRRHRCR